MTLRVNTRRGDRNDYLERLAQAGLEARPSAISDVAVYLTSAVDVAELPGFAEGLCSVQDEAAQLAAAALGCAPGDRVLDACAAPGGKSCHLLERCPDIAELVLAEAIAMAWSELTAKHGQPYCLQDGARRPGDCAALVSGSARAAEILGWQPEHSTLDQMITSAWRWHRGNGYGA